MLRYTAKDILSVNIKNENIIVESYDDVFIDSLNYLSHVGDINLLDFESENDYLPSDEVILTKIDEIKNYLNISGKEFFKWIIPKSEKDKRYGKLRKIKKEDLYFIKSDINTSFNYDKR